MHFQVVERALVMLQNQKVIGELLEFSDNLLLPVLRSQVKGHWCKQVRERIRGCMDFIEGTDDTAADSSEDAADSDNHDEADLMAESMDAEAAMAADEADAAAIEDADAPAVAVMDLEPQPWQRGPKRARQHVNGEHNDEEGDVNDVETNAKWRRLEPSTVGPKEP
jgi:hypothetical protein